MIISMIRISLMMISIMLISTMKQNNLWVIIMFAYGCRMKELLAMIQNADVPKPVIAKNLQYVIGILEAAAVDDNCRLV